MHRDAQYTATFTLGVYDSGSDYILTGQDATYNLTASGNTMPAAACSLSTFNSSFAFNGNGFALQSSTLASANYISGVLSFNGNGSIISGSWYATPSYGVTSPVSVYTLNSSSSPAPAGSTIVVYFTGGGPVEGQTSLKTGEPTPSQEFPITETSGITIDGMPSTVTYIGLVPTAVGGFYQADVVIPTGLAAGSHAPVITINGTASNSTNINTK